MAVSFMQSDVSGLALPPMFSLWASQGVAFAAKVPFLVFAFSETLQYWSFMLLQFRSVDEF